MYKIYISLMFFILTGCKRDKEVPSAAKGMEVKYGFSHLSSGESLTTLVGKNFYEKRKYEVFLKNEIFGALTATLKRESDTTLSLQIPSTLPFGNYRSTLLVDGKPFELDAIRNVYTGYADFYYRKSEMQPVINIISQPSNLRKTANLNYYEVVKKYCDKKLF